MICSACKNEYAPASMAHSQLSERDLCVHCIAAYEIGYMDAIEKKAKDLLIESEAVNE